MMAITNVHTHYGLGAPTADCAFVLCYQKMFSFYLYLCLLFSSLLRIITV
jgi:hypothetical protein